MFSQEIDGKIKKEMDDAANKAKSDPETPLDELTSDLYVNCLEPAIRKPTGYTGVHKLTNKKAMETLKTMGQVPPKKGSAKASPKKEEKPKEAKNKTKKDDDKKKKDDEKKK